MNDASSACHWFRPAFGGHLCLMGDDRVSRGIRAAGEWDGCRAHIDAFWRSPPSAGAEDVIVDVGANIGACTLQFLLQTNATVVAVEPSPTALFHLRASIARSARDRDPSFLERVVVVPTAVGRRRGQAELFVATANAGNAVLDLPVRDHPAQAMDTRFAVPIAPLDDVLDAVLPANATIRYLKADVQGYECEMFEGMRNTAPRVSTMTVELAEGWLGPHNCSSRGALERLRGLGFRWRGDVPRCVFTRFGCDFTVRHQRLHVD